MTRKEFSSRYDAYLREGSRYGWAAIIGISLLIMAANFLSNYCRKHLGITLPDSAEGIVALLILFGGVFALIPWCRSQAKKHGLECPSCGGQLTDKITRRKVLVTGDCPKCRNKVFDESTNNSEAVHRLNRKEFEEQFAESVRRSKRESLWVVIAIFGSMAGGVPLETYFENLVDRGQLDWLAWVQFADRRAIAGILLMLFVLFSLGFVFLGLKLKFQKCPLPCPACGRSLAGIAGPTAIESGKCIYCGCSLFEVLTSKN